MTEFTLHDGIPDFTEEERRVAFYIAPDVFECPSELPAETLLEFATRFGEMTESGTVPEQVAAFRDLLKLVMHEDAHDRFVARMRDKTRPISYKQLSRVVQYLLGEYGMRPTESSSDSSNGSHGQVTGMSSMATVHDVVWTPDNSPSTGS